MNREKKNANSRLLIEWAVLCLISIVFWGYSGGRDFSMWVFRAAFVVGVWPAAYWSIYRVVKKVMAVLSPWWRHSQWVDTAALAVLVLIGTGLLWTLGPDLAAVVQYRGLLGLVFLLVALLFLFHHRYGLDLSGFSQPEKDLYHNTGRAMNGLNYERAAQGYRDLLEIIPQKRPTAGLERLREHCIFNLCACYSQLGRCEESVQLLRSLEMTGSKALRKHFNIASNYFHMERWQDFLQEKAFIERSFTPARRDRWLLGDLQAKDLYLQGDDHAALAFYQTLEKRQPQNKIYALQMQATIYRRMSRPEQEQACLAAKAEEERRVIADAAEQGAQQ